MKVLVATKLTQGQREDDFFWCEEGELIRLPLFDTMCQSEVDSGACGCGRSLPGIDTHKSTTTFMVADLPMSEDEYRDCLHQSLHNAGWCDIYTTRDIVDKIEADLRALKYVTEYFPIGAVLELRHGKIRQRERV